VSINVIRGDAPKAIYVGTTDVTNLVRKFQHEAFPAKLVHETGHVVAMEIEHVGCHVVVWRQIAKKCSLVQHVPVSAIIIMILILTSIMTFTWVYNALDLVEILLIYHKR